jgi:hypothetical protein
MAFCSGKNSDDDGTWSTSPSGPNAGPCRLGGDLRDAISGAVDDVEGTGTCSAVSVATFRPSAWARCCSAHKEKAPLVRLRLLPPWSEFFSSSGCTSPSSSSESSSISDPRQPSPFDLSPSSSSESFGESELSKSLPASLGTRFPFSSRPKVRR